LDQNVGQRRSAQPFSVWHNGFTGAELDAITAYGEKLVQEKATIEDEARLKIADHVRITRAAWIDQTPDTGWIYDRLWRIGHHLNLKSYMLALSGLSEKLQYTIYESAEGAHYDWHMDRSATAPAPRKLALVLQLSDPADYEGCALEIRGGSGIQAAPVARGTVIAFPAYVLHRVTPIQKGRRVSLVSWISGPLLD
jgi:PKHD-type hydroxylase